MANMHPSELLPWYVNGTLDKTDHSQIEQHLAQCQQCQEEVAYLQQLRAQIKAVEQQYSSPAELGLARLKQRIRVDNKPTNARRWFIPALAAAAIVIIAQAGLLLNTNSEGHMQLMSAPSQGQIQVRFVPDASAKGIAALLQSISGEIIQGPSALGIYHLHIDTSADNKAIITAIQKLRKRSDIIAFVAEEDK